MKFMSKDDNRGIPQAGNIDFSLDFWGRDSTSFLKKKEIDQRHSTPPARVGRLPCKEID